MRNEELMGLYVTRTYVSLIKNEVQLKYPNFFFERGKIFYDYDLEKYIYSGFSSDEQCILKEAEQALYRN